MNILKHHPFYQISQLCESVAICSSLAWEMLLTQELQRSPSGESSISILCCSSKASPPSTKSSSKTRRKKGEGSGHIYYRTVTRNGKEYRQAYYQWRSYGKQRTKYIPNKLLDRVKEAESLKLPVADILFLLGGDEKCSSKSSDTSGEQKDEKLSATDKCSSKISPPSKKRKQGYGGGYIECKPIKIQGKQYKQYWYHYEFWEKGDRTVKKCRYIQAHLVAKVQKLEAEKALLGEILKLLGVKI